MWSSPVTTGDRPPPCSGFTFTAIDDRRAVVFGGTNKETDRINTVYIIDLITMVIIHQCPCNSTVTNVKSFSSRPGVISVSQKVNLGQRRGLSMQDVVSTMVSSTLNYWLLEDRTQRENH